MKTKNTLFLAAIGLCSPALLASDYPPGYAVEHSCKTNGPVEICAYNQHYGNFPRITINYIGYLQASAHTAAWVSSNGRSGLFNFDETGSVAINNPLPYRCWVGGHPDWYVGPYGACVDDHTGSSVGSLVWEIEPIPEAEKNLFYYARNEHGLANAWDIEVAIVNGEGLWDSLYGSNYKFRFEP